MQRVTPIFLFVLFLLPVLAQAEEDQTSGRGIYDKPYLKGSGGGVAVGGYMDMELEYNPQTGYSTFDQHRFVPFITGYVSDRVTVSAEIEYEHGGNPDKGGEVKIEYGVMDYRFSEKFNFRGGVLLAPLGRFNVLHDSPINDLTARPVVTRQLIPSTLSESGMGFHGLFLTGEESELDYDIYFVNGFNEGIINEDGQLRIRGGRGSQKADNNSDKAVVARAGFSPRLGTDLGVSFHSGAYDNAGEQRLTIAAFDLKTTFGALEIQGEVANANADIDRDMYATAAEKQLGAYAQANYHLLHDRFLDGSVVTLVVRGDWMDYDTDVDGDSETGLTLGANFRPTEETAFKLDWNRTTKTDVFGEKGDGQDRIFFSFATYF